MPKKRIYAYDFIRAFAIVMVVAVHCIPDGPSNAAHIYAAFMKALLFPCNAIFFCHEWHIQCEGVLSR